MLEPTVNQETTGVNEEPRYVLDNNFTKVANEVLFSNLTGSEFKIYTGLISYAYGKSIFVWPSIRTLTKRLHMSAGTISQGLRSLAKKKLIEIQQKTHSRGSPHQYKILKIPQNFYNDFIPPAKKTFVSNPEQTPSFVSNPEQTVSNPEQTVSNPEQNIEKKHPSNADEVEPDGDRNLRGRRRIKNTKESSSRVLENSKFPEGTDKKTDDDFLNSKDPKKDNQGKTTDLSPEQHEIWQYWNKKRSAVNSNLVKQTPAKKDIDLLKKWTIISSFSIPDIKRHIDYAFSHSETTPSSLAYVDKVIASQHGSTKQSISPAMARMKRKMQARNGGKS